MTGILQWLELQSTLPWLQLTYSQDKIIVRLVVDFIKDVEHFDGEVCYGAQVSLCGLFNLEHERKLLL